MVQQSFMKVEEVAQELGVSKSYAYKIVQQLNNGYAEAQYRMGLYFQTGENGSKNVIQAAYWYQKANLQGHVRAKTKLGECIADMPLTQRLRWNLQKNREA